MNKGFAKRPCCDTSPALKKMELADMAKEKKLIRRAWSKEDVGTLKTMAKDK